MSQAAFHRFVLNGHFLLYELGFSPLTLLLADYDHFMKACGHYSTVNSLLDSALHKLQPFLENPALTTLYACFLHRHTVAAALDLIGQAHFEELKGSQDFEDYLGE